MLHRQNVILVRQENSRTMGHRVNHVILEAIVLKENKIVLSALQDTSKSYCNEMLC